MWSLDGIGQYFKDGEIGSSIPEEVRVCLVPIEKKRECNFDIIDLP